jgi:pro-kumamolisin-like protein
MRIQRMFFGRGVLFAVSLSLFLFAGLRLAVQSASAQSSPSKSVAVQKGLPARITEAIDETNRVTLRGNVHPLARPEFDRGAVADSQPMTRMLLLLQRSPEQEAALRQLMDEQLMKDSPNFHAWLTPEQFGKQFGPADADIQTVTNWLANHGFQVSKVTKGRIAIEFSGTAAQVQSAFGAEIHKFNVKGEDHFANVSEPSIPAALAPVVRGVKALHTFRPKSYLRRLGTFRRNVQTGQIKPAFTFNDINGTFYGVGPADFATIYNINTGTMTGTGQSIAIVGQSNINIQDVRDFRSIFGLPANDPTIILNGEDPGLVPGDETESDLDVEWSGAVAPQAQIIFVTTEFTITDLTAGVDASAIYIVDNNVAPVMSESYGACEAALGSGGNAFYNSLWQQAAAEGITVSISAGDDGSAGCDDTSQQSAVNGTAVSGFASTPFNVAVGGTDFDQAGNQPTYWNATNTASTQASAKGYIPEIPWNDSCAATGITGCASATSTSQNLNIVAGSGGPSNCATSGGSAPAIACTGATAKPSWQTGLTPNDSARDIPDISLFAADGLNASFYIICESDNDIPGDTGCNLTTFSNTSPFHDFQAVGGTSAGAPAFAAIMALVNQAKGGRQGNANPALYNTYSLAKTANNVCNSAANPASTCVFYDVAKGNISVPCTAGGTSTLFGTKSLDCSNTGASGFGAMATSTGGATPAYSASAGYDYATGLGTLNVTTLLALWTPPTRVASTTTLSLAPTSIIVDQQVTVSGTVTPSSATGIVTLFRGSTSGPVIDRFAVSGGAYGGSTTTFFPGGGGNVSNTYNVIAHYSGDGANAASDSALTPISVAPQNSNTVLSFVTFNPTTGAPIFNLGTFSVPYGSPYILRIDVEPTTGTFAGQTCQNLTSRQILFTCPTGTVTLTSNGNPLNDWPTAQNPGTSNVARLNDRGFAEDQPIQLSASSTPYSLMATYSGDSSYNTSASSPVNVTINKGTTTTTLGSSVSTITAGGSVTLTATISTTAGFSGEPPCGSGVTNPGTVQFMNGSTALTGTVTYTGAGPNSTTGAGPSCTAVLSTALSMLAPPAAPHNIRFLWRPIGIVGLLLLILLLLSRRVLPAPKRRYAYAGLVLFACIAAGIAGCSSSNGGGGGGGGGHTDNITATYSGDANYATSTSAAVPITVH